MLSPDNTAFMPIAQNEANDLFVSSNTTTSWTNLPNVDIANGLSEPK